MSDQKPSIGRIVIFNAGEESEAPAIITKVHNDTCVNLTVFGSNVAPTMNSSVVFGNKGGYSWSWPTRV